MPTFRVTVKNRQILFKVRVYKLFGSLPVEQTETFTALLDTGATVTAISQNVVKSLALKPHGWGKVEGVHGSQNLDKYLVGIEIPVQISDMFEYKSEINLLEVFLLKSQEIGSDVLFGMNLISRLHLTLHQDLCVISVDGCSKHSLVQKISGRD